MSAVPIRLGQLQTLSHGAIKAAGLGGLTAHETALATGFDRMAIQPRISELRGRGLVVAIGERRRNPSGKTATVWIIAESAIPFRKSMGGDVRGKSAATPKRARFIWHDPCQARKMPAIRQLGRSVASSETSTNARHGEDSKIGPYGKGRGGARNYADRESQSLIAAQVSNLVAANEHACAIGLPFTRMITIHWESAGLALGDMARATGRFTDLMAKSLARHGNRTAWLWVHENGARKGGHCHLLAHVPADLVPVIAGLQRGWLRLITGRPYRKRVINSRPIGKRLGVEVSNPADHVINLEAALAYVLKGASPEAASQFALERLEPGGRVIGRRCSTSKDIARKARNRSSQLTAAIGEP